MESNTYECYSSFVLHVEAVQYDWVAKIIVCF